jgi:hypothetical protein
MTTEIRLWKIEGDNQLKPVPASGLDLEERLEAWLDEDISVLSDELLIIGRQVLTAYGGYIDLLCLDENGDTVVIELKRDRTPRQVTAQALDYGSWVQSLSNEDISELAGAYLGDKGLGNLEEAFRAKFESDLPDVLNESQSMLVVGSKIDPASERIMAYLSDTYSVNINAATFQFFKEDDREFIARTFLIEPGQVKDRARRTSKRKPGLTFEQLQRIADENDVGRYYSQLVSALERHFSKVRTRSTLTFAGRFGDSRNALLNLLPPESDPEKGLRFQVYIHRFATFFDVDPESVLAIFPSPLDKWEYLPNADVGYQGYAGYFSSDQEVQRFVEGLRQLAAND